MYPTETKTKFIELRAQGLSLARISSKLGVCKRTLVDWHRDCQPEISSLRAVELEALHERLLASHETEVTRLAGLQKKLETELARRTLEFTSTERLFQLDALVRRQLRDLCAAPSGEALAKADPRPPASPTPPVQTPQPKASPETRATQAPPVPPSGAAPVENPIP